MFVLFSIIVFVFGLIIGSFLNCVIFRLYKHKTQGKTLGNLGRTRSFCPTCNHILAWYDLIPVISFIMLRTKCRYCKKHISFQYPLVEIATGALFLLIFNFQFSISKQFLISDFQTIFNTVFWWLIAAFLIIIFVYDFYHYIIPDKIVYPAIIITLFYKVISNFQFPIATLWGVRFASSNQFSIFNFQTKDFLSSFLSALGAAGFFLAIVLVSRGKWMGIGDIKLAFLMGLVLGWPNILVALFISFVLGAVVGLALIGAGAKHLKSEVPFGPFLVTAAFIALFWGERVIHWYLSMFIW